MAANCDKTLAEQGPATNIVRVEAVRINAKVVEDGMRIRSNRVIEVKLGPEDALTIDARSFGNKHFQERADDFVRTLLLRVEQVA